MKEELTIDELEHVKTDLKIEVDGNKVSVQGQGNGAGKVMAAYTLLKNIANKSGCPLSVITDYMLEIDENCEFLRQQIKSKLT